MKRPHCNDDNDKKTGEDNSKNDNRKKISKEESNEESRTPNSDSQASSSRTTPELKVEQKQETSSSSRAVKEPKICSDWTVGEITKDKSLAEWMLTMEQFRHKLDNFKKRMDAFEIEHMSPARIATENYRKLL